MVGISGDQPMLRRNRLLGPWAFTMFVVLPLIMVSNRPKVESHQSLRNLQSTKNFTNLSTSPSVHYISARFGNGPGLSRAGEVEEHSRKIRESKVFTEENLHFYTEFPDWILSDVRWLRHLAFLRDGSDTSRRGAGYWFWKPAIILHHLNQIRDDDFIVYADSDDEDFLPWIRHLIKTMILRDADFAAEQLRFLEREWSKGDSFAYMSCKQPLSYFREKEKPFSTAAKRLLLDVNSDHSLQYDASLIVVRRNAETLKFFQQWRDAIQHYNLVSDEPSVLPNAVDFQENRHDQSLFSLLLKCVHKERKKQSVVHNVTENYWTTYTFTFQLDRKT